MPTRLPCLTNSAALRPHSAAVLIRHNHTRPGITSQCPLWAKSRHCIAKFGASGLTNRPMALSASGLGSSRPGVEYLLLLAFHKFQPKLNGFPVCRLLVPKQHAMAIAFYLHEGRDCVAVFPTFGRQLL